MKPAQFPGNPAARWRLAALPGSPVAQAHVPVIYVPTPKRGRHNPNVPDIIPEQLPRMTTWPDAPFIVVAGGYPNSPPAPIALDIRKKIGQTVYQKTYRVLPDHTYSTTPELQRRRMVIPADPRTDAQLRVRARFGVAVQTWHTLTLEQRKAYNDRGKRQKAWLEGLNLFIRDFARDHPLEEFADQAEYLRTHGSLPPLP